MNEKKSTLFSLGKNLIIWQFFLVLIGINILQIWSDSIGYDVPRFILIAILGFLLNSFLIKLNVNKKFEKSEKTSIKKLIFIIPIVIAFLLIASGLYSVEQNISDDNSIQQLIFGEYYDEIMEEAKIRAQIHWFVVTGIYLIFSYLGLLFINKKIDNWLLDNIDEPKYDNNLYNDISPNDASNNSNFYS